MEVKILKNPPTSEKKSNRVNVDLTSCLILSETRRYCVNILSIYIERERV